MKRIIGILACLLLAGMLLSGCGREEPKKTSAHVDIVKQPTTEAEEIYDVESENENGEAAEIDIHSLRAGTILTEATVEAYGAENFFYVEEISDEVFDRMDGLTFKDYSPVSREELRYMKCLHKNNDGKIKVGEMVLHENMADEVCDIFYQLYQASYPIEKMRLADDYQANDDHSMKDNNTSAYNTRYVEGTEILCEHAYGTAIDINPLYNPYYIPDEDLVYPEEGEPYVDRDGDYPYKIVEGDLCYQLFTEHGFTWGGYWESPDYQHFER